jgi:hypothetical protein
MSSRANMKFLVERRDRLRLELESVKSRLDEVEMLLRQFNGEQTAEPPPPRVRSKRGDVKETVLAVVTDAAAAGVTAAECVELALAKHGAKLQPSTVSSLLSRLKADDVLFYDGERYRLKQYAGPRSAA